MITNSYSKYYLSPSFGNSKSMAAVPESNKTPAQSKKKLWHLLQDGNEPKLYYTKTKQSYFGPFNVVKHLKKLKLSIQMKNKMGKTISFPVNYDNRGEVSLVYKEIKNASGYSKLDMILRALEKQVAYNLLRNAH